MVTKGFQLRSGDTGALATLMYSLGDLTKTLALRFDDRGVEAQEKVCQDCVLLAARLEADKFRKYRSWGSGGILLRPDELYIILSQAGQRDEEQRREHQRHVELVAGHQDAVGQPAGGAAGAGHRARHVDRTR